MSDLSIDTPTERTLFTDMTLEQKEGFLEDIRERRLATLRVYESVQEAKKQARNEKLVAKIGRIEKKIASKLEKADELITAVEELFKEVRGIQIEVETQ